MNSLDDIVNVQLVAGGSALSRRDVSTIACVVADGAASVTVDAYTSAADVGTARGLTSQAYKMALKAFSQRPRPRTVKVIRVAASLTHTQKVTVAANTDGLVTSVTVRKPDGTDVTFSYTVATDTLAEVATALAALIAADTDLGASAVGAVITITGPANGTFYRVVATTNLNTYEDATPDPGYATALSTARTIDDGWFGLCVDANSSAAILAVAAWAETNEKLFGAQIVNDVELTSGGTIGAALKAAAYDFTESAYHAPALADERIDVAWIAYMLAAFKPGRATWWGKTLTKVTRDTLTSTQRGFLSGDNINQYDVVASRNIMREGKAASGEWIDTIVGRVALIGDLQVDIAQMMFDAPKIDYTDVGISALLAAGDAVFERYASGKNPFLRPGTLTSSAPSVEDVTAEDIEAREINDLVWNAVYAGAIHKANLRVTLSITAA